MDWFRKKFDELSGRGAQAQPQKEAQPMPIYISPQEFRQPPAYSIQAPRPQVREILPGLTAEPEVQPNIYSQGGVNYHAPGYTGDPATLPRTRGRSGAWSPIGLPAMPIQQPDYPEFRTRRPM